ncbi:MAG: autotransporter-associated beta strand repeat-containing protein, partial [Methyloligella sp. ZOD6]
MRSAISRKRDALAYLHVSFSRRSVFGPMAIGVYAMLMVVAPRPTAAQQQTWTGNTSNDWLVGSNWSGGRVPTTGRAGDVFINTTSPNATVIGASGAVTATSGVVHMGNFSGTSSELTIQNGSTLTSSDNGRIGQVAGANSKVTVTGAGSTWTINSTRFSPTIAFVVGNAGTGTLNISNGGSVVTTNGGYFYIAQGATSSGTLNVTSGGVLITDGEGYVGDLGIGTATISGTNSLWNVGQQLTVGSSGAGTLTVADEGRVEVGGNLVIANNAGSTGTLNIGAAPGDPAKAPGIVETSAIQFGAGTGAINFNHTSTRYVFTPIMSGDGAVNQIAGTTILPGEHSYTGPTTISGGTLAVNGSITSDVTVQSGGTLAGIGMISAGVVNRGTVAPGNSIGTLTVTGNYVGSGGRLEIESVLAGNASPTDQLVLDGGSARGRTGVQVINLNGPGGVTSGNGIPVVVAQNGATTSASAFSLTGPVAAGPYQYVLRRGSGSPAEAQSWYLASHVQGSDNGGGHGGPLIPLYRPETSAYAVLPAMA